MRKHLSTIVLVILLLIGLSLLLYPTVSDYWNSFHQTRAIATYAENVAALDNASYDAIWDAARQYNRNLCSRSNSFLLSEEQKAEYESLLDISGQGVMGYIEIPEIDVSLPIYHGTEDPVLQVAVGHLEWTSLPVGGGEYPLRPLRSPGFAQRQAVHRPGQAPGGGYLPPAGAG